MLQRVFAPALVLLLVAGSLRGQDPVPVVFVVNSALEKDRPLPGVVVRASLAPASSDAVTGVTDGAGRVELGLARGEWFVSYQLQGHVPLIDTPLTVGSPGQVVTTSLLPALEGEAESGPPRIALVLNWGSDQSEHVRDCDSHLAIERTHVYFGAKVAERQRSQLHLDVDDMDWGGPETITVRDPSPGRWTYWVHDWSDGPGQLGGSEVVVRLLVGDTVAGEWRAPGSATARVWRPFQALEVADDGAISVVPFGPEELAAGADRRVPPEVEATIGWSPVGGGGDAVAVCCLALFLVPTALGVAAFLFRRALGGTGARR